MNLVISILLVLISFGMWLKLAEMIFHLVRLYPDPAVVGGTSSLDVNKEWPITSVVARLANKLPSKSRPHLFRFKVLIFILIVLVFFAKPGKIAYFSATTLYLAIWIHLVRILIDQVKYGSAVYLQGPAIPNPLFVKDFGGPTAREKLRAFLYLFFGQCAAVVFGFAAIFNLCYVQSCGTAFKGVPDDNWMFFHFIYFSIVTLATVGYGDMAPAEMVMPRFLVASEIIAGFLILVVLVSSVSLTFQKDSDTKIS